MEFVADSLPIVTWFRRDSEFNNITELQFINSSLYNTTGVNVADSQTVYRVSYHNNNNGFY